MATTILLSRDLPIRVSAWISGETSSRLKKFAEDESCTFSEALRRALDAGLRMAQERTEPSPVGEQGGGASAGARADGVVGGIPLPDTAHGVDNPRSKEGGLVTGVSEDESLPSQGGKLVVGEPGVRKRAEDVFGGEAIVWELLERGWRDLISAYNETHTCEPTLFEKNEKSLTPRRARAFDPAASAQPDSRLDPQQVVNAWNRKRPEIAAKWRILGMVSSIAYKRGPSKAVLGEALRRRIAFASRRLATIEAWEAAFDVLGELPAHVVNTLYLWELDRLCRIPIDENEQEQFRALPYEQRPVFGERLSSYSSWTSARKDKPKTEDLSPPRNLSKRADKSTASPRNFATVQLSSEQRARMVAAIGPEPIPASCDAEPAIVAVAAADPKKAIARLRERLGI